MHDRCCYRSALDGARAFCADCGGPLLRCAAFEECGGLVDIDGMCSTCFDVALIGAASGQGTVGGSAALGLDLVNRSKVGRPLFLKRLLVREQGGEWREQDATWERIDGGATMPTAVHSDVFRQPGTHRVEVAVGLASRWRWREEVFAFTAALEVEVSGESNVAVHQTIHMAEGGAASAAGTVYAPVRLGDSGARREAPRGERAALELARAGRLERALGWRGAADGLSVPRGTKLTWRGFGPDEAPLPGPITTPDGVLALGRSRARGAGGDGDVRLLARTRSGALDEQRSLAVSRRHLSLWIENDRLSVRADGERGARVGRRALRQGETAPLRSGDEVRAGDRPDAPGVRVLMQAHHDIAHTVELIAL